PLSTPPLHDALPICRAFRAPASASWPGYPEAFPASANLAGCLDLLEEIAGVIANHAIDAHDVLDLDQHKGRFQLADVIVVGDRRSEEHTSELQSREK